MHVIPVDASDLGNRAYVVSDGARALVVDPPRPVDAIVATLSARRLALDIVAETHLHNDHVSGGRELAARTGARYVMGSGDHVAIAEGVADGDHMAVGRMSVEVVATPGHTPHHVSYVVRDGDATAVFSGGALLIATVGRTDLCGDESTDALARAQWASVRRLLASLPPSTAVHPTHGFGSFCAAAPAACAGPTTIGDERARNPAAVQDCDAFTAGLLAGYGDYPSYYAHMAALNREGAPPPDLGALPPPRARADGWLVDVRPRQAFALGHAPGAINAGVDGPLATYLGWTMPWGTPLDLVAGDDKQLLAARRMLAHIGVHASGATVGECGAVPLRLATFADLAQEWDSGVAVLDVRLTAELRAGRLRDAHHLPLHRLPAALADLPTDRTIWLHCAAGYRAALGASLLQRRGLDTVAIDDAWASAAGAGLHIATDP